MNGRTHCLAKELVHTNIRVNTAGRVALPFENAPSEKRKRFSLAAFLLIP
jgi:hypothetical protein